MLTPRCQQQYRRRTYCDQENQRERISFDGYVSEVWPLATDGDTRNAAPMPEPLPAGASCWSTLARATSTWCC